MKDIVLEVKELAIEYRTRKSVVQAVNGISFQVPRGTTMGLVGETGAGKTTTSRQGKSFPGRSSSRGRTCWRRARRTCAPSAASGSP